MRCSGSVWDTFSSSTNQQDADRKEGDQSTDVFSKHPQMLPIHLFDGNLEINSLCEGAGELPLNAKTSEKSFRK